MKPHKGQIKGRRVEGNSGPFYQVTHWYNHPEFGTRPARGHTSLVVEDAFDKPRHKGDSYEIETLNSRYTVVPKDYDPSS